MGREAMPGADLWGLRWMVIAPLVEKMTARGAAEHSLTERPGECGEQPEAMRLPVTRSSALVVPGRSNWQQLPNQQPEIGEMMQQADYSMAGCSRVPPMNSTNPMLN
jgi:hypothetical protein